MVDYVRTVEDYIEQQLREAGVEFTKDIRFGITNFNIESGHEAAIEIFSQLSKEGFINEAMGNIHQSTTMEMLLN